MSPISEVIGCETPRPDYLRLNLLTQNAAGGSIDFIGRKVNFNIGPANFYKGMAYLRDITLDYRPPILTIGFKRGAKTLSFICSAVLFEQVKAHIAQLG